MGSVYLKCRRMTTRLDKTLKRELTLEGRTFILAVSPEGLKLNASLGTFARPAPGKSAGAARLTSKRVRRARKR